MVAFLFQRHGIQGLDTEQAKRARLQSMQGLRNQFAAAASPTRPADARPHDELSRSKTIPMPSRSAAAKAPPVDHNASAAPTPEPASPRLPPPNLDTAPQRFSMPAAIDSSGVTLLQTAVLVNAVAPSASVQSSASQTPDQTSPLVSQPEKPAATVQPAPAFVLKPPPPVAASPSLTIRKSSLKQPQAPPGVPPPDFAEHMARSSPVVIPQRVPSGERDARASPLHPRITGRTPPLPPPPVLQSWTAVSAVAAPQSPPRPPTLVSSVPPAVILQAASVRAASGALSASLQESVLCPSGSQSDLSKSEASPVATPPHVASTDSLNMSIEDLSRDVMERSRSYKIVTRHEIDDDFTRSVSLKVDSSKSPIFPSPAPREEAPTKEPAPSRNIFDFLRKSKHEVGLRCFPSATHSPQRNPTVIINDDYPLYYKQTTLDPSAFPTTTTEKARKLKFYIERQLGIVFKALGDRETRKRDVCPANACTFRDASPARGGNAQDAAHRQTAHVPARRALGEGSLVRGCPPQPTHCQESEFLRSKRATIDRSQFSVLKTIGRGAFGEVMLVRRKDTDYLYAMKTLRKSEIVQKGQIAHVKAERDILSTADNDWLVRLYYSFQDKANLYFVMEYVPVRARSCAPAPLTARRAATS